MRPMQSGPVLNGERVETGSATNVVLELIERVGPSRFRARSVNRARISVGDRLRFHATGAYTASYSSVGFNGFAPLKTHCI